LLLPAAATAAGENYKMTAFRFGVCSFTASKKGRVGPHGCEQNRLKCSSLTFF
jgi:hypothetical protein